MKKPLLVTDCDEVLLHMVAPFAAWVERTQDMAFDIEGGDFTRALTFRKTNEPVPVDQIWPLLRGFFRDEMGSQTLIPGALDALDEIGRVADIAILTNVQEQEREGRIAQLKAFGIEHPVHCNQGGKGEPLLRIIEAYNPSTTVFVDDLPHQHESVALHAPHVWRLHMVGEPRLAPAVKTSENAHARIDDWPRATAWIFDRFNEGLANAA